jgi:hypothetical protein
LGGAASFAVFAPRRPRPSMIFAKKRDEFS